MKLNSISLLVIIGAAVLIGAVSHFFHPNNLIEEHAETYLEDYAEGKLGLDDDALKGRIDLTPFHPEDGSTFDLMDLFGDEEDQN